jgi:hypothetical protein
VVNPSASGAECLDVEATNLKEKLHVTRLLHSTVHRHRTKKNLSQQRAWVFFCDRTSAVSSSAFVAIHTIRAH